MRIDLHMHSNYSDGQHPPAEVVRMAAENEVSAISLTDHDCLDGIPEAIEAAKDKGIEVLTGVELSSEFKGRDLHILGYGVDVGNQKFQDMLVRFRETRHKRGLKIIEKLNDLGIPIEPAEVLAKAGDGALGRPHIASVLAERGFVSKIQEAFDKYIADGGPAYVPKYKMSPEEAIEYVHLAGGIALIAHPGTFIETIADVKELLEEGFDGVEVYHPSNNADLRTQLRALADSRGLAVSGGSDYHGHKGRDIPIGSVDIPDGVLENLKERIQKG